MKKKEALFRLIRSLGKREKAYFRMWAGKREGEKKYLRLFDAIEKQESYDAAKLKRELRNEKLIRQLPVAKNYLYANIMRSLRSFHSQRSLDNELREEIRNIEILYEKGLYAHCRSIVNRVYRKAKENEKHLKLLEILNWKRRLDRIMGYRGNFLSHDLDRSLEEELSLTRQIANTREYDVLSDKYFLLTSKAGQHTRQHRALVKKFLRHRLLRDEKLPLTYHSKYFFHTINSRLYHSIGELRESYGHNRKLLELIAALPPQRFREEKYNYIIALYNYLIVLTYLGRNDEFEETIRKIRALPVDSVKEGVTIFYTYLTELDFYIANRRFSDGIRLEDCIHEGFRMYGDKVNRQIELAMCFNLAYAFTGAGKYKSALRWINRLLNKTEHDLRADIYCMARLLNIIIHYELGHQEMLTHLVQSTHRYLVKREFYGDMEELLLQYFGSKLPGAQGRKEQVAVLKKFRNELEKIISKPASKAALQYFDFKGWLESRISGQPWGSGF